MNIAVSRGQHGSKNVSFYTQQAVHKTKLHKEAQKSDWLSLSVIGWQPVTAKVKLWISFFVIHTLAELPWSLRPIGYNRTPSSLLIKCDMLLKVWASHEMGREGKGMKGGYEQDSLTFYLKYKKLKVNPRNLGLACGDCWGWWRWDGVISPDGSAERLSDINTPIDKPQHLLVQKNRSSLCRAVVIGNTVQLWPWNQDLA